MFLKLYKLYRKKTLQAFSYTGRSRDGILVTVQVLKPGLPQETQALEILAEAFGDHDEEYFRSCLEEKLPLFPDHCFLVAVTNATLVGILLVSWVAEKSCVLHNVAVSQAYRGRGIAMILLKAAEEFIKRTGRTEIYLESKDRHVKLYEKAGYKNLDLRENSDEIYVMQKQLERGIMPGYIKKLCPYLVGLLLVGGLAYAKVGKSSPN